MEPGRLNKGLVHVSEYLAPLLVGWRYEPETDEYVNDRLLTIHTQRSGGSNEKKTHSNYHCTLPLRW